MIAPFCRKLMRTGCSLVLCCFLFACSTSPGTARESGYITVDSCKIYYESTGTGTPIIILHGNGFDLTCFSPHLDTLAQKYRLIFTDMRGSGKSIDQSSISLDQLAHDVDAVRQGLGLDKIVLMGHSLGGLVAMKYATLFAGKLDKLILVAPNAATAADTTEILPAQKSKAKSKAQGANYDASFATYNLLPELSKINIPTLLLSAERDPIPASAHDQIASAIKNSTHITIKDSGHFIFVDQPAAFCDEVNRFLGSK